MKKLLIGAATTATIVLASAGAAFAANSGSLNVSTNGAYTSGGTFNFYYANCSWGPNAWDGFVAGTWHVTTPDDHLNGTVDGYGWTRLKSGTSVQAVGYSYCLSGRDVTVHDSISI